MSRFRFPLEPLLERCAAAEREAHGALFAAASGRARAVAAGEMLCAERRSLGRTFAELSGDPRANARDALIAADLLASAIERQAAIVADAQAHEAETRARFVAVRREHRRLSLIRDRAHAAHLQAIERAEARALDDANAVKHNAAILFAPSFHN